MIRMKDVSFRYLNSTEGVSGIDLMVNEGECVVFTGPSGGGKTTLTRLLNALAPSYYAGTLTGTISINGKSLTQMPQYTVARQIGSVFQDPKSQFFSSELAEKRLLPVKTMDSQRRKYVIVRMMRSFRSA